MPSGPDRVRLVVLFGGQSAEHGVSCVSAAHVLRATNPERYDVLPVGITRSGEWVRSEAGVAALTGSAAELPERLDTVGESLEPMPTVLPASPAEQVVVLPILHGPMGEDGTVQGMLELAGVPYVGSGVLGSALCMDKVQAKIVTEAAGIPQCRHEAARDTDVTDEWLDGVLDRLGVPVFVKPANLGSSVGVTRVNDGAALRAAVEAALAYDEWVVIEEAVRARELEVGVIGNARPRASVPGEIVPTHDFYDYEDKYLDGAAEMVIPADLPSEVTKEIQDLAIRSFKALRCDGLARVDFFYEEDGRGLLLNEVNTMPGFTPYSMFPSLWGASGLPYNQLIDELVRLALERHAHRTPHRTAAR